MVANFNNVVLLGNLTRDPELRYTPAGVAVCEASIAVNRRWTTKDGEKKEEVSYFDLVIWAKSGETFAEYLKKGRSVLVAGELRQERWKADDGSNRSRVKITVHNFQFIGAKDGSAAPSGGTPLDPVPAPDENVPF